MNAFMPFGKHKGRRLDSLPDDYLHWLHTLDNLQAPLRRAVEQEWTRRFGRPQSASVVIPAALRDVTRDIITLGYKAAAKRYHPDVGGTHEGMLALQSAANLLRQLAG